MFNLFSKKTKTEFSDSVWMTKDAKNKGLIDFIRSSGRLNLFIMSWFSESLDELVKILTEASVNFVKVDSLSDLRIENKVTLLHTDLVNRPFASSPISIKLQENQAYCIFCEHFPLHTTEMKTYETVSNLFKKPQIMVYQSLDQKLFEIFGSERIVSLMKSMGMQENESIEHSMISKAITNAQKKIEKKLRVEQKAKSEEEWFRLNYRG